MHINFLADNAFTRKHARLIYRQFFPFYLRGVWLQWLLLVLLIFVLWQFVSFVLAVDGEQWLASWGLPESFTSWPHAPLVALAILFVVVVLAFDSRLE